MYPPRVDQLTGRPHPRALQQARPADGKRCLCGHSHRNGDPNKRHGPCSWCPCEGFEDASGER